MGHHSMHHVEADGEWSLFSPDEAPGLHGTYGAETEELYEPYECEGRARKTIPAQKLWYVSLDAQIETGGPFMLQRPRQQFGDDQLEEPWRCQVVQSLHGIMEYSAP